jgi:peptide/nickel transport system permease protein
MTGYIIRRLGQTIIVVLGVTLLIFVLKQLEPADQIARSVLGSRATQQQVEQFNRQQGLDRPLLAQYFHFLNQLVHGNLGYSWEQNRSVDSILATEWPRDAVLVGLSLFFSVLIAVPLGIWQAVRRNSAVDYAGTGISFLLYSMPPYVPGILAIALFSIRFQIFPPEAPQEASAVQMLLHPAGLVLPVLTLTLVGYALFTRYMRSSAIDSLAQDYIRTARAKGVPEGRILRKHLLRNSLVPVVTLIGVSIPAILTAGLITEYLFNFPGVGLEYFNAATHNDFPVMIGITVVIGVVTVLGNLVADISYAVLDPRVRY